MMHKSIKIGLITTFLVLFSFALITNFTFDSALAADNIQKNFNLSLVISNNAPTISDIGASSGTPTESTNTNVYVYFNVTDTNGFSDIDPSQSYANISLSGVVRNSSSCTNYATWTGGNIRGVNCTIALNYFDESGTWNIYAYGQDAASSSDNASQASFTYNTLYAFDLVKPTITFSASGVGINDINASNDPQILNNTGNGAFTSINVTGYELSNGADTIQSGNFTINGTADAKGISVAGNVNIPSASLPRSATQDLYVWVDVPAGITSGSYVTNSTTQWIVEAFN